MLYLENYLSKLVALETHKLSSRVFKIAQLRIT